MIGQAFYCNRPFRLNVFSFQIYLIHPGLRHSISDSIHEVISFIANIIISTCGLSKKKKSLYKEMEREKLEKQLVSVFSSFLRWYIPSAFIVLRYILLAMSE